MAQISVPESVGRDLFYQFFDLKKDYWTVDTDKEHSLEDLQLPAGQLFVVKPDHAMGKRGKQNLLGLRLDAVQAKEFVQERKDQVVQGMRLHRFIICPFIEHDQELYVSLATEQGADQLLFSAQGGVDIEEQWETVHKLAIPLPNALTESADLLGLISSVADTDVRDSLAELLPRLHDFMIKYGLASLEINPLAVVGKELVPLDMKLRIDNCEFFRLQQFVDIYSLVGDLSQDSPEEREIKKMDDLTFASLKMTLLNRNGRIWPLIAGGGASIIYFDSLVDKGLGKEIGFYGEYSGNPPTELLYRYTKIILKLLIDSTAEQKVLVIAGANANFTDIVATMRGIMQALEEVVPELREQQVQILVRRGGPRVEEAFAQLKTFSEKHQLAITLEGLEHPLPHILEAIR